MVKLVCVLVLTSMLAHGAVGIPLEEYRQRREALREKLTGGVVILMGETEEGIRSPFFQEANFYYLSGWEEPGAILVIGPEEEVLFIPRRDPDRERWHGAKADPLAEEITEITGFEKVRPAEAFEASLAEIVEGASHVYTIDGSAFAEKLRAMLPLREIRNASEAIARLRMRKSKAEQELIRRSTEVTMSAFRAAWERIEPARFEYEIAGAMSGVYFSSGCGRHAYAPIVGSGPNSTVLHYNRNSRRFDAGELVLMDVGAECSYYATDITRTVPASGKFSKRQKEIYNLVLGAQRAVIHAVKPGVMVKSGPGSLYQIAKDYFDKHGRDAGGEGMSKYFIHGIGHHVGLEVHDAHDSSEPLEAGMILTVEPGLYIPEENLGIRIEDIVLVTDNGHEVLSRELPKTVKDLERALR